MKTSAGVRVIYKLLVFVACCVIPGVLLWVAFSPSEAGNRWYWCSGAVFSFMMFLAGAYGWMPSVSPLTFLRVVREDGAVVALRSTYSRLVALLIVTLAVFIVIWAFFTRYMLAREVVASKVSFVLLFPVLYGLWKVIRNWRRDPAVMRFQHRRVEISGPHAITLDGDDVEAVVLRDRLWRASILIRFSNPDAPRPFSEYWIMHFLPFGPRELAELMAAHLEVPVERMQRRRLS